MAGLETDSRAYASTSSGTSDNLIESFTSTMAKLDEAGRYRLLGELLTRFADSGATHGNGESSDQLKQLARKVQELEKVKADLEDQLNAARVELTHRESVTKAAETKATGLQATVDSQRSRLDSLQQQLAALEAQMVEKNAELHAAQRDNEQLTVKLQRLELQSTDRSGYDRLDQARQQAASQVEALQAEMERLRQEKNAEIEKLREELRNAGSGAQGADALLASLWDKLAQASPALVKGGFQPNAQAAERLVECLIEMAAVVYRFDQDIRVFLNKYTKHNPTASRPWKLYADQDNFYQILQQILDPVNGKNVGILKMKLKMLHKWSFAAMLSNDGLIESIAAELQTHLMGPAGAGSDPKCTIRDYVKNSGPDHFLEHMLKFRGDKLVESIGFGG